MESFEELSSIYAENEKDDNLVDALNELPSPERNLFIMFIECGCHYKALARRMNCNDQTIRRYIFNIRKKIIDKLQ